MCSDFICLFTRRDSKGTSIVNPLGGLVIVVPSALYYYVVRIIAIKFLVKVSPWLMSLRS